MASLSEFSVQQTTSAALLASPLTTLSITGLSLSGPEGQWWGSNTPPWAFAITRSGDLSISHAVAWTVVGAGANPVSGDDFYGDGGMLPSGTVTFAPGEAEKVVGLPIWSDSINEPDESFAVALNAPTNGAVLGVAQATGTVVNDDAVVIYMNVTSVLATEGRATTFYVHRAGDLSAGSSVDWSIAGTGLNLASAEDFMGGVLPSGTVHFAPGESYGTITVDIAGDRTFEPTETFRLQLSSPSNGVVLQAETDHADGTISNTGASMGSALIWIAASAADRAEGNDGTTPFTFSVFRSGDSSVSDSVAWSVAGSGSNPASASDFVGGVLPSGTVTFAIGESTKTITINVAGDSMNEASERFTVNLASPSEGVMLGTASATGIIRNDDQQNALAIRGTSGNDVLLHQLGGHVYDGGDGHDVLDMGSIGRRNSSVMPLSNGDVAITSGANADVLSSIEEVHFSDGRLVFDAADPAAQVVRLYKAALGRAAEQEGLNHWVDQIGHGSLLSELGEGFLESAEFQSRYGTGLHTSDYVEALYINALGRGSDPGGKAHWVSLIDGGEISRAEALVGFSESVENRSQTAGLIKAGIWDLSENAAFIARLYDTVLGRLPDAQGLINWRTALEAGMQSRASMVDGFMASDEFKARYGADTSAADFVELLYNNALHRESDPSGKATWVSWLDSGAMTRASAVLGFSESAEHVALTAANVMSDDPNHYGIAFA